MNERLRAALTQHGVALTELAAICGVDPKTVSRWIGGRRPQPRYRLSIAHHLGVSEDFLWPESTGPAESATGLVGTYTNRASIPRTLWPKLICRANEHIDILVFAGNFLASADRHIVDLLAQRAGSGTRIRLCFGDPDRSAVAIRGEEEGLGAALAAKCRASIDRFRLLAEKHGCEIRLHNTTLYNSLFRFDENLLVNPHIWGQPAAMNPVLHVESTSEGDWFSNYTASFDAVWTTAQPWDSSAADRTPDHLR